MYVTDFREEALKDIIESLDPALFERVTGLTVEDFPLLNKHRRLQRPAHERRDLPVQVVRAVEPALRGRGRRRADLSGRVGGWDTSLDAAEVLG